MPAKPSQSGAISSGEDVQTMFDKISGRYDLMNHLMTMGLDIHWRNVVAKQALGADGKPVSRAIDVACGTGDMAITLRKSGIADVTGLDFSEEMIAIAKRKSTKTNGVSFVVGDGMHMPYEDNTFDVATIGFGLRNLPDYQAGVAEMTRVVKPGGKVIVLEMTPYRRPFLGIFYRLYFEHVLPIMGGIIAGNYKAYKYLPQSVRNFPDPDTLAGMFANVGLEDVRYQLLGFGAVALHVGTKA